MDFIRRLFYPPPHKHGPVDGFLHNYSYHPRYFLSLPFLWKVQFYYSSDLISSINKSISKEPNEKWRAITDPRYYSDAEGRLLVARSVVVPNENTQFDIVGSENLGGFLPGYAVNKRQDFLQKNLAINFFETDTDIEHLFFRPWMVALSIDGLMMRDLICPSVVLTQYNNRMEVRKEIKFNDVFPTNVEGYSVSYEDTDYKEKSITFAFKNYEPVGPEFGAPRATPVFS